MTSSEKIDSLLKTISTFRDKLLTIKSMCEGSSEFNISKANTLVDEGLFDLIQIKHLNEIVQINCENKKEECEKNQEDIGKDNLEQKKYEYHLDLIKNDIFSNKQLKDLKEEKKKNEEILKKKNNYIKDFPKYIDIIEKETSKAQKIFNDSKK